MLDEWTHLAITYNREADTKTLYVNGEEDAVFEGPPTVDQVSSYNRNSIRPFNIGAGEDTGTNFFFNGIIDDVSLWDETLSQDSIQTIAERGVAGFAGGGGQTIVIDTGIDTTLAEGGLNGPDIPHGAEGANPDGVERWEFDGEDGGGVNHGLLWFDIPDNVLAAFGDGTATLALHVDNNGNAGDMHRMSVDWLSGADGGDEVTWNNIPDGPGVIPGGNAAESNVEFPDSIGREGEVLEVDVSEDLRAWAAGEPNYGWGFVPIDGATDGHGITSFENLNNPVPTLTLEISSLQAALQAGDADQDLDFDQLDLVAVQIAGKYLTGDAATWGEGDWNGAPGGSQGSPARRKWFL